MSRRRKPHESASDATRPDDRESEVRIIGGEFRGRRLNYHGDPIVRPMKHRTREAIFNLISTECTGRHAIDLFAGTGALGLEALSRGAVSATFIEKHVPSARVVQENLRTLGVEDRATLQITSAFLWGKRDLADAARSARSVGSSSGAGRNFQPPSNLPWLVFCSPPYAFFHEREADMCDLVGRIQQHAPRGSILIVEADEGFDFGVLQEAAAEKPDATWDVRRYAPAVVGIWRN